MATRTTHIVVDDLDGSTQAVTTRRFGVDGVDYEIDLSPANSAASDQALLPCLRGARRLPRSTRPHRRRAKVGNQ